MRAYLEIHEQRGGTRDTARPPLLLKSTEAKSDPPFMNFASNVTMTAFTITGRRSMPKTLSHPSNRATPLFVKVVRGVQKPYGLRVATENDFFGTEAITTEVKVASRPGLGGTA